MADINNPYAAVLFDLAEENGGMELFVSQAVFLQDTLQSEDSHILLGAGDISYAEKKDFCQKKLAGRIENDLLGFLLMMINENKEDAIITALDDFIEAGERHINTTWARVMTARALSEQQIAAIQALLIKKLNKPVNIETRVNPAIIGGLRIHVEDRLIDYTIQKQIEDMKSNIQTCFNLH